MVENKSRNCRELGVCRSSLYYKRKLADKDEELKVKIEQVMLANPGYGHRRVALALKINHKRALRVMNQYQLKPTRRAKAPRKESAAEDNKYPNVALMLSPLAPNIVWVADFTYIPFAGGFVYLATVVDLFTKEILGFAVKTKHDTSLILEAFDMALTSCGNQPEWFHNDRGSEYRSTQFETLLVSLKIQISISPKPWFNGSQESMYGRFKTEFGDFDRFDSLPKLIEAICLYINYYNNFRIHMRIKMPPVDFKNNWFYNQKRFFHSPLGGSEAKGNNPLSPL